MKHLLYEHQNNLTEMKAEGTVVMKLAQKEHRTQEGALRKDMRALKAELKEQELASEVVVKNLRLVGVSAGCWGQRAPDGSVATGNSHSCLKGPAFWQLVEIVKKKACIQTDPLWGPSTEFCLRLEPQIDMRQIQPQAPLRVCQVCLETQPLECPACHSLGFYAVCHVRWAYESLADF